MKNIVGIVKAGLSHRLDGHHPVRSLIGQMDVGTHANPFLHLEMVDPADAHAPIINMGPELSCTVPKVGVIGMVFAGQLFARGKLPAVSAGEVLWLIANGTPPQSPATDRQGTFEGACMYVRLPDTVDEQVHITPNNQVPGIEVSEGLGQVRLIAGELLGKRGPVFPGTGLQVFDLDMKAGAIWRHLSPPGNACMIVVRSGRVRMQSSDTAYAHDVVILGREKNVVQIEVLKDARLLYLSAPNIP